MSLVKKALAVTCATVVAGSLMTATPAAAANGGHCSEGSQSKSFDLPNKVDITFLVGLCFRSFDNGKADARSEQFWSPNNHPDIRVSDRFDAFSIEIRIEHRDTKGGADRVISRWTCDLKSWVNSNYEPYADTPTCWMPPIGYTTAGYWSADGTITYDINNDGKGPFTWDLAGTPLW